MDGYLHLPTLPPFSARSPVDADEGRWVPRGLPRLRNLFLPCGCGGEGHKATKEEKKKQTLAHLLASLRTQASKAGERMRRR